MPGLAAAQVEEITVTASKRSELLRDVPQSVTALTGGTLERLGAQSFEDYATLVPSLSYLSSGPGQNQITLRGITSGANQSNASVGTYIDDVPFGSSTTKASGSMLTPDIDTFDIDRVEVLRGPQGTLYGASTLGGLVKYVTKAPSFDAVQAKLLTEVSSVNGGGIGFALKGVFNAPINDKVALRFSAYRRNDAGFIDAPSRGADNVNQARFVGGRMAVEFRPADALTVRLNAFLQDIRSEGTPTVDVDRATLKPFYGDLVQKRTLSDSFHERWRSVNATVNYDAGWASLVSSTSYAKVGFTSVTDLTAGLGDLLSSFAGTPLNVLQHNENPVRKWTQELRLASPATQKLEWQVGGFVTHERSGVVQQVSSLLPNGRPAPAPFDVGMDQPLMARYFEYAAFANLTYHVTSSFDVAVGARWSRNEQHYSQRSTGFFNNPDDPTAVDFLETGSADQSWTYSVAPRWHVADDAMLYARVAKGYRPGGPNAFIPAAVAVTPKTYRPDSLVNYEVGAKTQWFDKRLSIDLSAFYIDWSSVQISASTAGFSYLANGGAADSKGFELSVSYSPIRNLTIAGNVALTDAHLTVDAPDVGGVKGDRLPTVPRWSGAVTADYQMPLWGSFYGTLGASYRYVGARPSDYGVAAGQFTLPSYDVFDLRAGLGTSWMTATLFVKNVADTRGIVGVQTLSLDPAASPFSATVIRPRTIGLTLTADF